MARNVNVRMTNWTDLGTTVPFPRYDVDIYVEWIDDEGDLHSWEGTARIPNDLELVPMAWLREELKDLILRATRKRLGVD